MFSLKYFLNLNMKSKKEDLSGTDLIFKPGFLPLKLVTKFYGISRSYLYQLRYERKIFHYDLGSRVFIKISELEDLIEKGKRK